MTFLVETFTDLKPLSKFIPPIQPNHPPTKSHIVPMKILFLDENYKSVTLDILSRLLADAGLSGDQQVRTRKLPRTKAVIILFTLIQSF